MEKGATQLQVTAVAGKDLKAKYNAYVVVTVLDSAGNASGKPSTTKPVKKTQAPNWNEKLTFAVSEFSGVQISLWHKQKVLADKFLGQVTIKINKDLLNKSPIDDWFPLSSRPNKKDSVQGSLQLKIQYGEGQAKSENNNDNATVIQEKQNLKVSSNWNTKDVTKSPYAIVEDEQKSPRIPEEDEESSAEEPDDLPDAELAPFTAKLTKIDATEVAQVEAEAEEDQEAEHANEPANDQPVEPLEPLNTESLEKLLSRATPIQSSADDEKNFAVRETSLKAPKTGERLNQPFPPPPEVRPEVVIDVEEAKKLNKEESGGELQVLRHAPKGALNIPVTVASLTFNQPMVPVASISDLKELPAPATFEPKTTPGRWVWKGTTTVQYEAEGRFPFSTAYTITVPSGTKSMVNGVMGKDFVMNFTTNTPLLKCVHYISNFSEHMWTQHVPNNSSNQLDCLGPTVVLRFDQRIDPAEVIKVVKVANAPELQLLSTEETLAALGARRLDTNEINASTFFGFRFKTDLNPHTSYNIIIGPQVPSLEGPLKSTSSQSVAFSTYPPFGIDQPYKPSSYHPRATWRVYFTNPIDMGTFNESMVKIKPALKKAVFRIENNSANTASVAIFGGSYGLNRQQSCLIIENDSEPGTKYKVTVDRALCDVYEQKLTGADTYHADVGPGYDSLTGPSNLIVLDPKTHPTFTPIVVGYREVHVKVYQVAPTEYFSATQEFNRNRPHVSKFGKVVHETVLKTDVEPGVPKQLMIDLRPYLQFPEENLGQLIVRVEPTEPAWRVFHHSYYDKYEDYHPKLYSWVQSTRMCVDTIFSQGSGELLVWASMLEDGKPATGANILAPNSCSGKVNDDGIILFPKFGGASKGVVMCSKGNDVAFTPVNYTKVRFETYNWFVFDDRKLYRPKEEVYIKGYMRFLQRSETRQIVPVFGTGKVTYNFRDPRGAEISKGELEFNKFGAFDLKLSLPDNMNLGNASVLFTAGGTTYTHTFKVEEFRRPEYEVSSSYMPISNHIASKDGGFAVAKAKATYFSGGGLSDAKVKWTLEDKDALYSPPGWSKFSFGDVKPWWANRPVFSPFTFDGVHGQFFGSPQSPTQLLPSFRPMSRARPAMLGGPQLRPSIPGLDDSGSGSEESDEEQNPLELNGKTDANGEHEAKIVYAGNLKVPKTLRAIAAITDLNYQTRETSTSFLLHPSLYYIGVNVKRAYGKPNDLFPMEVIVTDIDGKAKEGVPFWIKQTRSWVQDEKDAQGLTREVEKTSCKIVKLLSKNEPLVYEYFPKDGGQYTFEFITTDDRKLRNETKVTFNVSGAKATPTPKITKVTQEEVIIIPDKQTYSPFNGETTGELLVQSPFKPAEGLLTLLCEGVVHTERFKVVEDSVTLKFPIKEDWQPNLQIQVDLMGSKPRALNSGVLDLAAPPRPCFAKGLANINVVNKSDELKVDVSTSQSSYKPGSQAVVNVHVTDAKNEPVANAEVCVIVVDESVLALTGYTLSNPLSLFNPQRRSGTGGTYLRSAVLLISSEDLQKFAENAPKPPEPELAIPSSSSSSIAVGRGGPPGGGAVQLQKMAAPAPSKSAAPMARMSSIANPMAEKQKEEASPRRSARDMSSSLSASVPEPEPEASTPIEVRSNFTAIANFTPSLVTDNKGNVSVEFKLPDSLTKYRVWAVAVTDRKFGLGEAAVVAKLPFMVRPSFPRFLNLGDKAECSVVLQNQTDQDLVVRVAARCTNARFRGNFTGGYRMKIGAAKRVAIFLPVETKYAGTARFQIIASSEDFSDAAEISLPVWTPATSEAFATYGDISDKTVVFQPVKTPKNVYKEFGGFEVQTSSTVLQSLTDAVLYLWKYEFDCSEQLASRILGIVSLKDVLQAFNVPELPSNLTILLALQEQLKTLLKRQEDHDFRPHYTGGFYFWKKTADFWRCPDPFISVHVTHCLAKAQQKGVTVDKTLLSRAHTFLKSLEKFLDLHFWWMSKQTKYSLLAYCLYVRQKLGDDVADEARNIYEKQGNEGLNFDSLGWLMIAMYTDKSKKTTDAIAAILKFIQNRVNETAETANFITKYSDQEGQYVMLHSDRRVDGVLLEALLTVDQKNGLIPKLAKGLLAHRKAGKWGNTQENCLILVALDLYFAVYEKDEPNFTAQVWLGEIFAGEQSFKGRTTETNIINVPMQFLFETGDTDLILTKDGPGRLYYRLAMNYAPDDLRLKAACYGFKIQRTYEGVDDKKHVTQDKDGNWHFKLGEKVRVSVMMTTTSRRYHIALVDKLPAGVEIINSALKGVETGEDQRAVINLNRQNNYNPFTTRVYHTHRWYEHQNLRDERAEAFQSLLWEGHYEYKYICRATTEGVFIVPPAKAEEMYSPEIFGRSATDIVYVEK